MELQDLQQNNLKELEGRVAGEYEKIVSCADHVLLVERNPQEFQYVGKKWESGILAKANPFSYGLGLAKRTEGRGFVFFDKRGKESEEFYYADDYHGKVALVQPTKNGAYYFRSPKGDLSSPMEMAGSYSDGYYVVKLPSENCYRFANADGEISVDSFAQANGFNGGFALVCTEGVVEPYYRDMLGRLSEKETKSGRDFYLFVNGLLKLNELNDKYFEDEDFARGVIEFVKRKTACYYREAIERKDKQEVLAECREAFSYVIQRSPYLGFCDLIINPER